MAGGCLEECYGLTDLASQQQRRLLESGLWSTVALSRAPFRAWFAQALSRVV